MNTRDKYIEVYPPMIFKILNIKKQQSCVKFVVKNILTLKEEQVGWMFKDEDAAKSFKYTLETIKETQ